MVGGRAGGAAAGALELAWELESGDPDRSSDQSLVEAVVAFRRVAAWAEVVRRGPPPHCRGVR